ncbi:MAG TPA: aldo/keto reductase, partial [Gemmatales bacterium]|nr:aldo/keto reductase [Gemmatales bacterium]
PEAMLERTIHVLDEAWKLGIRWFDAARSYGLAEDFLQTWLRIRDIDPAEVTISSKWGYTYTANWKIDAKQHEIKDLSLGNLRKQINETSARLGPWLKLYQIHSATLETGVLENHPVLDELARLRDGGLIIGLSVSGVEQSATIEKALTIQRGGSSLFGSIQATWNIYEQSAASALQAAQKAGWLVIIKEGLANGRLAVARLEEQAEWKLECQKQNVSLDAAALATILAQPFVDVVLSGATTVAQLQSNVKAMQCTGISDWKNWAESSEIYWKKRSALAWN